MLDEAVEKVEKISTANPQIEAFYGELVHTSSARRGPASGAVSPGRSRSSAAMSRQAAEMLQDNDIKICDGRS